VAGAALRCNVCEGSLPEGMFVKAVMSERLLDMEYNLMIVGHNKHSTILLCQPFHTYLNIPPPLPDRLYQTDNLMIVGLITNKHKHLCDHSAAR
jgi:hypothetical protein